MTKIEILNKYKKQKHNTYRECDVINAMEKYLESYKQDQALQLQQTDVIRLLLLFDQMIKEENEALGKAGFYNQYCRETHANNKYCLAIVKSLIERRFGNSG